MPGWAVLSPVLLSDGMDEPELWERCRCPKSRQAASWRRSDIPIPEVLPHGLLNFRRTVRTVGMRERELGRIHTVDLAIQPLRNPGLTTRGKSRIVSNECADTTDGEQRRYDERLSCRSGKRLTGCWHKGVFKRHEIPPNLCRWTSDEQPLTCQSCLDLVDKRHTLRPSFVAAP
jgi:hypothetical protein